MPSQLKSLLPLLVVLILIFLIARHFLVPESFGKYGHYRANSMDEIAALPIHYAGNEECIACHNKEATMLSSDVHSTLACEICHGPGAKHADDPETNKLIKLGTREDCGKCHSINPARRIEFIDQIDTKTHHPEKRNCIDCHNPHAIWELKN